MLAVSVMCCSLRQKTLLLTSPRCIILFCMGHLLPVTLGGGGGGDYYIHTCATGVLVEKLEF